MLGVSMRKDPESSGLQSAPLSVWCDFSRKLPSRPQRGCTVIVCSHFWLFHWDSDTRPCAVPGEGTACTQQGPTGTGSSEGLKLERGQGKHMGAAWGPGPAGGGGGGRGSGGHRASKLLKDPQ